MKKLNFYSAIAVMFISLTCIRAYGQQQETSDEDNLTPKFGIKGGLNFSNLYTNSVGDDHLKLGGTVGFYGKLPITKGLSIQPELLYSNKGAKTTYNNFAQGSGEYRFNLNYVELPVLLVVNIVPNFNLQLGGYAAFLASANVKDVNSDGTINGTTNLNADDFHKFDYGLSGGVGVDIQNFTIGARYNYGLANIGKSGNLSGDLTNNSKNSVATLFIGFAF